MFSLNSEVGPKEELGKSQQVIKNGDPVKRPASQT